MANENIKKPGAKEFILAVRPQFLTITAVATLLGFATARYAGVPLRFDIAAAALLAGLLVHAGANVINDVADDENGTDSANVEAIRPFTGGSGTIQSGAITRTVMRRYAVILFLLGSLFGAYLVFKSGLVFLFVWLAGLFLAWSYSAKPFSLMSRGLGELAVAASWLLMVLASDVALRGTVAFFAAAAAFPFALLVANLLIMNEFPDAKADASVGKKNLVVRLGSKAPYLPLAVAILAYGSLILAVAVSELPRSALFSLAAAFVSFPAALAALRSRGNPEELGKAVPMTILAAHLQGIILAAALFFS